MGCLREWKKSVWLGVWVRKNWWCSGGSTALLPWWIHISFEEQWEGVRRSQVESYWSRDAKGLSHHAWIFTLYETHSNTIMVTGNAFVVLWTHCWREGVIAWVLVENSGAQWCLVHHDCIKSLKKVNPFEHALGWMIRQWNEGGAVIIFVLVPRGIYVCQEIWLIRDYWSAWW